MENVILLSCPDRDAARAAAAGLQRLHDCGELRLEAAAVLRRHQDGRVEALDEAGEASLKGTAVGGLIGAVVGLLTGPLGLLLGGAAGAAAGSLVDIADAEAGDQILRSFSRHVPAGRTAAIAIVDEPSPGPVDALAAEIGVAVVRRPRSAVEIEVLEAEEAAIAAQTSSDAKRSVGDRVRDIKDALSDRR